MGEEKQKTQPRMLAGMCGMFYEMKPFNVKEAGQLSNPWLRKCDHCGATAIRLLFGDRRERGEPQEKQDRKRDHDCFCGKSPLGIRDYTTIMLHLAVLCARCTWANSTTFCRDYVSACFAAFHIAPEPRCDHLRAGLTP